MNKSLTGRALIFVLRELVGELLYFPVWWYSRGLTLAWRRWQRQWWRIVDRLGIRYLLINMGKPMYGDYSRSGRVISFFFRLLLVGYSLVVLAVWTVIISVIFVLWIVAPLVAMAMLVRQLIPVQLIPV